MVRKTALWKTTLSEFPFGKITLGKLPWEKLTLHLTFFTNKLQKITTKSELMAKYLEQQAYPNQKKLHHC